jgi:hypothetical protein
MPTIPLFTLSMPAVPVAYAVLTYTQSLMHLMPAGQANLSIPVVHVVHFIQILHVATTVHACSRWFR